MADLTATRNHVRARANFAVADAAGRLQQFLRETSPRKTGEMQSKTTVTVSGLTATAKAATEYASYVRDGTREYKIPKIKRVKKKGDKMLEFYWPAPKGPNKWMYLPQVTHPETKGKPWWDNALKRWSGLLEDGLRRAP